MRQAAASIVLILWAAAVHAQSTSASVAGRVTDASGAVIVDARITP